MKSTRHHLELSVIRLDFQPSENLIEDSVVQYVHRIKNGEGLPALIVRFDGEHYFLQDGFHRVEAAKRCGVRSLEAEVFPGTLDDMEREFQEYVRALRKSFTE
jgi:uncharacterized protein (DUF1015 family)